ncbi:MAG TPA: hypothetical protein VMV94_09965 [Phycisphaerae bacterium]|nr:hypothetical protein [Phycisphaerae bacterium]
MKPETLQRLLIDRHLGELPPDVTELVDAYAAMNATAAEARSSIQETLDLARRASAPTCMENLPALPPLTRRPSLRTGLTGSHFGTWTRAAVLAATIVLTFLLGTRFSPSISPQANQGGISGLAATELGRSQASGNSFWALSAREKTKSHLVGSGQHIDWPAPFKPSWKGEPS